MGNAKTVLILIILEYIYITLSKKKEIAAGVLILIILEYIYISYFGNVQLKWELVLILIILEYIYIYFDVDLECNHMES